MKGAVGWIIQGSRLSRTHFHYAMEFSLYDLLSSLCLAQEKIKIGFSSSNHLGYKVSNGWAMLKFIVNRGHNYLLISKEKITFKDHKYRVFNLSTQTEDL